MRKREDRMNQKYYFFHRPKVVLLILLLSLFSSASNGKSYKELVKGLGPAESWLVGANELLDLMFVGPQEACLLMSQMSSSTKLRQMLDFFKNQRGFESLGFDEPEGLQAFGYKACVAGGLFSKKPPKETASLRVSKEQVIEERVDGKLAIVKARFADGTIKQMLLVFEDGVWKTDGIVPAE